MGLTIQSHVIAPSDDPLDALVGGTYYKAYLVANPTLNDAAEASAKHYGLPIAYVYSATAFYPDNEAAINQSIETMRGLGKKLGERTISEHLAETRARQKK